MRLQTVLPFEGYQLTSATDLNGLDAFLEGNSIFLAAVACLHGHLPKSQVHYETL